MGHGRHHSQTSFNQSSPVPPPTTVLPASGTWQWPPQPGWVICHLIFAMPMSAHVPEEGHFVIKYDGIPWGCPSVFGWYSEFDLGVNGGWITPKPTTVTISYDGLVPLFASAGGLPVAAFTDLPLTEI